MLTSKDIQLLVDSFSKIFATKLELQEEIQKLRVEMNDRFRDVFTKLDPVFKEVKDMRQEQSVHAQQDSDIHDELDSIKKHTGIQL